jgi:oligopeptide transport system permease protein
MGAFEWTRLVRRPRFVVGAVLLALIGLCAVSPGAVVAMAPGSHDPRGCSVRAADGSYRDRLPPSRAHWFGTDAQGCEVFTRVVFGARASVSIGVGAAVAMTIVGLGLGLAAGYRGGWVDAVVRRTGDVTLSVPFVVGAILILSVLAGTQRQPWQIALTLAALTWPGTARVARTAARTVMVQPYIEATRAAGGRARHIVLRHVLPNAIGPVLAYNALAAGALTAAEGTLTYLGVGLQIPTVSWGLMIEQAQGSYERSPHLVVFPALFLVATVAAFILLGDAIGETLQPKQP